MKDKKTSTITNVFQKFLDESRNKGSDCDSVNMSPSWLSTVKMPCGNGVENPTVLLIFIKRGLLFSKRTKATGSGPAEFSFVIW